MCATRLKQRVRLNVLRVKLSPFYILVRRPYILLPHSDAFSYKELQTWIAHAKCTQVGTSLKTIKCYFNATCGKVYTSKLFQPKYVGVYSTYCCILGYLKLKHARAALLCLLHTSFIFCRRKVFLKKSFILIGRRLKESCRFRWSFLRRRRRSFSWWSFGLLIEMIYIYY